MTPSYFSLRSMPLACASRHFEFMKLYTACKITVYIRAVCTRQISFKAWFHFYHEFNLCHFLLQIKEKLFVLRDILFIRVNYHRGNDGIGEIGWKKYFLIFKFINCHCRTITMNQKLRFLFPRCICFDSKTSTILPYIQVCN